MGLGPRLPHILAGYQRFFWVQSQSLAGCGVVLGKSGVRVHTFLDLKKLFPVLRARLDPTSVCVVLLFLYEPVDGQDVGFSERVLCHDPEILRAGYSGGRTFGDIWINAVIYVHANV